MDKLTDKKQINGIINLFMFIYLISYITRINYGAIIVEMEKTTGFSKSVLSLALTGSSVAYGTGQIISGICGDRFQPKALVSFGVLVASLMNIIIPFCPSPYLMTLVWCVNGFAQSFLWPPLVKLSTTLLSADDYKVASVKSSWGSSFGTIVVYLLAPLIITVAGWKVVFWFSAFCALAMLIVWNKKCPNIPVYKAEETVGEKKSIAVLFTPMMLFVMLVIVLQGALRDGVTTWMPSYISETYNLGSKISILTGVVLPVFSIFCYKIVQKLYQSKLKNPITCAGTVFGVGAIASVVLIFVTGQNAVMSVVFSALLAGSMHGVNLILICMLPPFFEKYGNVSTVSGVLNACTYVGSAVSTYGIASISENMGWNTTILLWCAVAVLGTAVCFAVVPAWRKFEKK